MPDIRNALIGSDGVEINSVIAKPTTIERLIVHFAFLLIDLFVIQLSITGPNSGCCKILWLKAGLDFENAHTATIKKHVVGIKGKNKPIIPNAVAIEPRPNKKYFFIFSPINNL